MNQTRGENLVLGTVCHKKATIIVPTGASATLTLNGDQSGSLVVLNNTAGCTITLPDPSKMLGHVFDFVVSASAATGNYKIITNTATVFLLGDVISDDTDSSDAMAFFKADGTTDVACTMNGTTTGGLIGTRLRFTSISTTVWLVEGVNKGNGTVATPFATS